MNKLTEKRNTLYAQAQALVKKVEDEGRGDSGCNGPGNGSEQMAFTAVRT